MYLTIRDERLLHFFQFSNTSFLLFFAEIIYDNSWKCIKKRENTGVLKYCWSNLEISGTLYIHTNDARREVVKWKQKCCRAMKLNNLFKSEKTEIYFHMWSLQVTKWDCISSKFLKMFELVWTQTYDFSNNIL